MIEENPNKKDGLIPEAAQPDNGEKLNQPKNTNSELNIKGINPSKKASAKNKKKVVLASVGVALGLIIAFVIFVLIFASQAGAGNNPLLQLFGVDENDFLPLLIKLVHVFFGIAVFICFIVTVLGVFGLVMAKKGDKKTRKKSLVAAISGALLLAIFAAVWGIVFVYLDSKIDDLSTEKKELIVTVPDPTIGLTAPMTIKFDASKIPYNPSIFDALSYEWDFGDGESATGPTVSHRYLRKGEDGGRYTVNLTITFEDKKTGKVVTEEVSREVSFDNEKVTATFTVDAEEGEAPFTVKFDASGSIDPDGQIVSYEWDLDGDGDYDDGEGQVAEFTYEQSGTFEAKLRVLDNNDEFDVYKQDIKVKDEGKPLAIIEVTDDEGLIVAELDKGKSYSFSAEESYSEESTIKKYLWDFGDGTKSKSKKSTHKYDESGEYIVKLTVEDNDGKEGESERTIVVDSPEYEPQAKIKSSPAISSGQIEGEAPLPVSFDATLSTDGDDNITNYEWDFDGDGNTDDTGEFAAFTYSNPGTFQTTLTITDADGNISTDMVVVNVISASINASVVADPISGEVPLTVSFDASNSSYPGGTIVAYEWSFGDGTSPVLGNAQISHQYVSTGTFAASVKVVSADGTTDTQNVNINILPVSLTACFDASSSFGPAPLSINFDPGCSTGTITQHEWDFGNGDRSFDRRASYEFTTPGDYNVTLKVIDANGIVDDFTTVVTVE